MKKFRITLLILMSLSFVINIANASSDDGHEEEDVKYKISQESIEKMGIKIGTAKSKIIDKKIRVTGQVIFDKNSKANIKARFPGIVKSVNVNFGEEVKKGQVLARVEANNSLRIYNIISPINGTILSKDTNVGDVTSDASLFTIADLSSVWAKFHIFPKEADFVKKGQKIEIHTLAKNKNTVGKIDMLFPTADELSQTQIAISVIENKDQVWKPGITVEGDIIIDEKLANIAIEETSLQKSGDGDDVIYIKDGNEYEAREIEIGRKSDGFVEILEGLSKGEQYVSKGSFILKSESMKSSASHGH